MTNSDLVAVYNATDEVQALLYREMLQEAEIDVVERPLEADWLEGVRLDGLHSQLLVKSEDAERARALIAAFAAEAEQGELSAEIPEDAQLPAGDKPDTAE